MLYATRSIRARKAIISLLWHYLGHHIEFYSETLRRIFSKYHGIEVGLYSHGACFIPDNFPPGTVVGRYCSLAMSSTVHDANHPLGLKSTSALFFNPYLGYIKDDINKYTHLKIGNDVWFGHNSIILPSCESIGDGAVIAAGAVVSKSVPPYGVMVGNPARLVRYRFTPERIALLREERWWENDMRELVPRMDEFTRLLEGSTGGDE